MQIGPYRIDPPLVLAPMAGVTDRPFRKLCRQLGAGLAVSEMTTSDPGLWHTDKSRLRREHAGEPGPISVQIAGTDPGRMAEAARFNIAHGAQIIDINMGCPAKKVCRVDAGSALLRDEPLVARICAAVVDAAAASGNVPVTLKIRTGYSQQQRNGVAIARIAQDCGIAALTVHGRTRDQHYTGAAEYDTIAAIRQAVAIPVIANGDIDGAGRAQAVLRATGADAVMIGRAAQGRPWVFQAIAHFLQTGQQLAEPTRFQIRHWLLAHLDELYDFYGEGRGVRVARKHIQWYCHGHAGSEAFWRSVSSVDDVRAQRDAVERFFDGADVELAA